jgi:hypothetical protein
MLKSILFIVLASVVSALSAGCISSSDRGAVAFIPRDYPVGPFPRLGPVDGSNPGDPPK